MSGVQVERRCGMVTGATCRNVGLSWLPAGGRHGTRTWVLSTQNGDTTRRIRLSPNEIGALTDILRMLADGERATPFRLLDDDGLGLPASERERLWVEYCTATTRRRCFTWSHGVDA